MNLPIPVNCSTPISLDKYGENICDTIQVNLPYHSACELMPVIAFYLHVCPSVTLVHCMETAKMKKSARRDANTARWLYSKVGQKMFAPPQTTFPGAQDGQKLISWRWSLPSPTDPVWWRSMHAISSYHGNRPTNTHTPTNTRRPPATDRTDNNTLRRR